MISFVIGYSYIVAIISQFICASVACKERFCAMKRKISQQPNLNSTDVDSYVALCMKLLTILKKINKYLTFPLILIFLVLFIDLTLELHEVLRTLYGNESSLTIMYNGLIWTIVQLYPIVMTIYFSESTWKSVEDFKNIGTEILCNRKILDFESERTFNCFIKSIKRKIFQGSTIFFSLEWKLLSEVKYN